MKCSWRSQRTLAIAALVVVLAGGTVALLRSRPISNTVLGAGWVCSRTALIVTTCAPTDRRPAPNVGTSSKDSPKPRV
jgi:hypothetical protein